MYKISLGLHCRKGAHYFPNWQACGKQKKRNKGKKKKCFVFEACCCRTDISVQQTSVCVLRKKEKYPPPPEQKQRNQGHLRTACQLLFFLAILRSMCAGKARISTTNNNHFLRLSEHIQLHFRRQICTVMTAR